MIPLFKIYKPNGIGQVIEDVYNSGFITEGEYSDKFEYDFGQYIGNPNTCLVNSCTSALTIAAHMCGVGAGDEVITTAMTCFNKRAAVQMADGSTMQIHEIVDGKLTPEVMSFNVETKEYEKKRVTGWVKIKTTSDTWYRLELSNSHFVKGKERRRGVWVTGDHKILTKRGYVRVDELTPTDLIVTDKVGLNDKQMEFFDGCMLGDGHIRNRKNSGNTRFTVCHSESQSEWLDIKERIFTGIPHNVRYSHATDKRSAIRTIETTKNHSWSVQRKRWYNSRGKKRIPDDLKITPLLLATWYMDDGSLNTPSSAMFMTECFDANSFWKLFYKLVDYGFKPHATGLNTKRRITLHGDDVQTLFNIIGGYIPEQLRYKLGDFKCPPYDDSLWDLGNPIVLYDTPIVSKHDKGTNREFSHQYCIEVEDNHNFIVSNMVVSNCMATNEPFFNVGAKLVFADIDPTTGNIDPDSIESKITNKTKAIVVVHWAGQPAEITRICEIGAKYGIKIIEDAAHALRASENGKLIGNHGDYICFSFQAIKHLSTVDGGAIVCKTKEDADRIRKIRWFGLDRHFKAPAGEPPASRWEQDIKESGYKMHMNNVNAAIGLEQMKYIDELIDAHIANGREFDVRITNPRVEKLRRLEHINPSYWIYSVLVDDPKDFKAYMGDVGIATDVVHVRNDKYSVFEPFRDENLTGLTSFSSRLMHIPVGWWLSIDEVDYIIDMVNAY